MRYVLKARREDGQGRPLVFMRTTSHIMAVHALCSSFKQPCGDKGIKINVWIEKNGVKLTEKKATVAHWFKINKEEI